MEGYSVTEAASVLGVPTERVWELLARGILSGAPEGETGMRVFLQPRPAPTPPAIDEPRPGNGNAGGAPQAESSPFRELLTEFRNLTERYGQALLALGEARGEVASLRSRVDLLEARFDLRLPMSGPVPQPAPAPAGWSGRAAVVEPAAGTTQPADAAEPAVEEPPRRKRTRGQRRATDEFAEALARAEDPTPAELPGAADAAAAFAALRDETQRSVEADTDLEASLPRDLPAAEPIATLEPEPPAPEPPAPEPPAPAEAQPVVVAGLEAEVVDEIEPAVGDEVVEASEADMEAPARVGEEPVAAVEPEAAAEDELQPSVAVAPEPVSMADVEAPAAGTVVRFETAAEVEPERPAEMEPERPAEMEPERPSELEREREPDRELELEPAREEAWTAPPEVEPAPAEAEPVPIEEEPVPIAAQPEPEPEFPSWSTGAPGEVEDASMIDRAEEPAPAAMAEVAPEATAAEAPTQPESGSVPAQVGWDRGRYTTEIEGPDWIPEEPEPAAWTAEPAAEVQPQPSTDATSERMESEAFGWGQEETEVWFGSGRQPTWEADEPIDDEPVQQAELPAAPAADEAIDAVEAAPIEEDPAEEMEVAGASGHVVPGQPEPHADEASVEQPEPAPWAPAPSRPPPWAERLPDPSSPPPTTLSPTTARPATPPPTTPSPFAGTTESGPASRAYRRLRRIFPG